MRSFKITHLAFLFVTLASPLYGQDLESSGPAYGNDEAHPCINEETYRRMEAEISKNRKLLGLDAATRQTTATTLLEWPLRPASTMTDCGYYYISAFVDQDNSSGIQDWNCGMRTYNGHRGIDIVPWPFIWDKMDNNLVEVIAAAAGTIVAKVDGNPDRVCDGIGGGGSSNNYITVQHADGSTALYVHLKTGSLTSKAIGQTVATGEYLGIVGSAGQSTGAHLHFEVRSDGTFANYIDPFDGSCNAAINTSWWAAQKPYAEPGILKLSLHESWPYMASCPITVDTTYEQDTFTTNAGAQATFYACTKHVLAGDTWNFRILDSNQGVLDSWTYSSTINRLTSTLGWNKTLPTVPGTYTFEGTFNSITCSSNFTIVSPTGIKDQTEHSPSATIFPNPNQGTFRILLSEQTAVEDGLTLTIHNQSGKLIDRQIIKNLSTEVSLPLAKGIYFYVLDLKDDQRLTGKFVIY